MDFDLRTVDTRAAAFCWVLQRGPDPRRLIGAQGARQSGFEQVQAQLCLLEGDVTLLAPLGLSGVDQQVVEPFL